MKKAGILLISLSLFTLRSQAAEFLVDKLKEKGFSCQSANNGDICKIDSVKSTTFNYSQPIAIFVPKNVRQPTEMLLHLHGHRCVCEPCNTSPEKLIKKFKFPEQMKAAGASNAVLILPSSTGQCTTFEEELAPRFDEFTKWVNSTVEPAKERWIISGHSGAGRAIGTIVGKAANQNPEQLKKVDSVLLLDATYSTRASYYEQWRRAFQVNPKLDVFSVYRKGTSTKQGSQKLKSSFPDAQISGTTRPHCQVPTTSYGDLLQQAITDKAVPTAAASKKEKKKSGTQ